MFLVCLTRAFLSYVEDKPREEQAILHTKGVGSLEAVDCVDHTLRADAPTLLEGDGHAALKANIITAGIGYADGKAPAAVV